MHAAVAPEIYALDLDFTMYRSDLAFEDMVHIAAIRGLATGSSVRSARTDLEATGGSFDFIEYLVGLRVPQSELEGLLVAFANNSEGHDYLYPDARSMLKALRETATPFFTYTKGGRTTQMAKLGSCGLLDEPYLITDDILKGNTISAMRQGNGVYRVDAMVGPQSSTTLTARTIFLVEDKAKSFEGLPYDCAGALVGRVGRSPKSQLEGLPEHVATMPDLAAVTQRVYQNVV